MFRLFSKFNYFYAPADDLGGGNDDTSLPASDDPDDIVKFIGEDGKDEDDLSEPPKEVKKEVKKEEIKLDEEDEDDDDEGSKNDEDEKEDDDLEALLEEVNEPDDEKLELVTPVRRREILKKYPELFKDFPYLEKAYYREQQFTQLLPTIEDAKLAVEKGKTLDRFEHDLLSGNAETLFKTVRETNPNSFYKIVDELMPVLARVDEKAYTHVLGNTIKHTIISMLSEARRQKNDTLESAAVILNQFVFGNSEFAAPTRLAQNEKPDDKNTDLDRREQQFFKQQFDVASGEMNSRVNNAIAGYINTNIDPKNSMTEYVKKTAVRDANEMLANLIGKDNRFKLIVDKLWEDAFKNNFSKDSLDRIKSAYTSKARTLLPTVIKKARIDALKGMGKRVREESDNRSESRSQSRRDRNDSKEPGAIPKGMSTLEFLNKD